MLTDEQILKIIEEWRKKAKTKLKQRETIKEMTSSINKEVIDVIGVRRSGKSSILFLIIQKLDLKDEEYLYINFEDPAFIGNYNTNILEKIWDVYNINYSPKEKPYLFFDEVQNIQGWEQWVRKMRDLEKAHIFVTGSSSKLLSAEFGTKLTGRHLTFKVLPLSFKEYLIFKDEKIPATKKDLIQNEITLRKAFKEFMYNGGFPEIALTENKELLKNYFDDLLYKDIIIRHEIRDANSLRRLAVYCLSNIGQKNSYNSLRKQFSQSLDAIKSYMSYLEESFLIFQTPFFSYSLKSQEAMPRKIYCIDNGLRNAVSFKFSKDEGKLAENLVFVELKRREKEVYYWQKMNEADFVIKNNDDTLTAINVTYSDKINNREIKGLLEFKKEFKKTKELIILTKNTEKKEQGIRYSPLWKWMLE